MAFLIFRSGNWASILTVAFVCSVFLLHVLPSFLFDAVQPRRDLFIPADLLVHSTMFFPWMFMDGSVFLGKGRARQSLWLACGVLACIGFECMQLLATSRSFSFLDMACNLLGLSLGALAAGFYARKKAKK